MCGIAGWIEQGLDPTEKKDILCEMSKELQRRGPDESGQYFTDGCALMHRRLTIIDKENGKQPMLAKRGNEKYILVYNGELYNTEELRRKLCALGYVFKGHSDTEVVLNSYLEWGGRCCEQFNGIFAFAVYEEHSKKLFLCRDQVGVKPLFYHLSAQRLIFASEIKAILKSGAVRPYVDEEGLYELIFLSPARTPGKTPFRDIAELKPGECAVYQNGRLTKRSYYKITAHDHTDGEAQTIERVRYLITDSIERQLVSDVDVCTLLSGGLDSSIITYVASDYFKRRSKGRLSSFSVEYVDNSLYFEKSLFQPTADTEFIGTMSRFADTLHREIVLDNFDVAKALDEAVFARDLPAMADIDSSMLLFLREIRKSFKVGLSGECADEIFGGYPWYHNENILWQEGFPWSRSQEARRKLLKSGALPQGEEYVKARCDETLKLADKLPGESKKDGRMREMFILNFYWFMQCLLDRKDRCSMYSGLEVRVPFCDIRLIDYAYNMPWELKAYAGREKGIVRKAFEDILPYDIVWRKKSPYPKTHNPAYLKAVTETLFKALDGNSPILDFIDINAVRELAQSHDGQSLPWYGQLMKTPQVLAFLLQLDIWFKHYGVILV